MLADKPVAATIAVKDLDAATKFYEGTLGLKRADAQLPDGTLFQTGSSYVFVYQSQYAGTNQATYVGWAVGDEFDSVVDDLRSRGVSFERYDLPDTTRDGDVHVMGDLKSVWFKDPDGNILNIGDQTF
jgi:catechol 2,3-dioxygenase-like lactoylglutathione lyase family enzyme